MEKLLPKYMQRKNRVKLELPLSAPTKLTKYDADNTRHHFNLVSNDYKFSHPVLKDGSLIATLEAMPCNIFTN